MRCLFFRDNEKELYEERTVLVKASSHDEAIATAERDAEKYAKSVGSTYQGYADTFHIFDEAIATGTEIFSLMRDVKIGRDAYIDRFS